jgi:hypothetical protein
MLILRPLLGALGSTSCHSQHGNNNINWPLQKLACNDLNTYGLPQMIRAGENPCPSRSAVRQLAGSLEVHQRGRGWEVNQPWLRCCQTEG